MKSPFLNFGALSQKELPLHRNAGMEVVYVSEGRPRWVVEGQLEEIPAGSFFFTLPWQAHGSESVHEAGNRIHFVQFKLDRHYRVPARAFGFDSALGVPTAAARRISRILAGTSRHAWPASPAFQWLIRTLVTRLEEGERVLFIQGLFLSLLSELTDIVSGKVVVKHHMTPTERRVHELAAHLETDCSEDWTLSRMKQVTRLGATQLTAIFKRLTGDSPVAYLKRARVMKAETLLETTSQPIIDIAFECGFSSAQLFCRIFRQFTHRSPSQYRRESPSDRQLPVQNWSEAEEQRRLNSVREHDWI